jgi:hypothetical protein
MMAYIRWLIIYYMPFRPLQRWLLKRWLKHVIQYIPQITPEQQLRAVIRYTRRSGKMLSELNEFEQAAVVYIEKFSPR